MSESVDSDLDGQNSSKQDISVASGAYGNKTSSLCLTLTDRRLAFSGRSSSSITDECNVCSNSLEDVATVEPETSSKIESGIPKLSPEASNSEREDTARPIIVSYNTEDRLQIGEIPIQTEGIAAACMRAVSTTGIKQEETAINLDIVGESELNLQQLTPIVNRGEQDDTDIKVNINVNSDLPSKVPKVICNNHLESSTKSSGVLKVRNITENEYVRNSVDAEENDLVSLPGMNMTEVEIPIAVPTISENSSATGRTGSQSTREAIAKQESSVVKPFGSTSGMAFSKQKRSEQLIETSKFRAALKSVEARQKLANSLERKFNPKTPDSECKLAGRVRGKMSSNIKRLQEQLIHDMAQCRITDPSPNNVKQLQQQLMDTIELSAPDMTSREENWSRSSSGCRKSTRSITPSRSVRPYRQWLGLSKCVGADSRYIVSSKVDCASSNTNENPKRPHGQGDNTEFRENFPTEEPKEVIHRTIQMNPRTKVKQTQYTASATCYGGEELCAIQPVTDHMESKRKIVQSPNEEVHVPTRLFALSTQSPPSSRSSRRLSKTTKNAIISEGHFEENKNCKSTVSKSASPILRTILSPVKTGHTRQQSRSRRHSRIKSGEIVIPEGNNIKRDRNLGRHFADVGYICNKISSQEFAHEVSKTPELEVSSFLGANRSRRPSPAWSDFRAAPRFQSPLKCQPGCNNSSFSYVETTAQVTRIKRNGGRRSKSRSTRQTAVGYSARCYRTGSSHRPKALTSGQHCVSLQTNVDTQNSGGANGVIRHLRGNSNRRMHNRSPDTLVDEPIPSRARKTMRSAVVNKLWEKVGKFQRKRSVPQYVFVQALRDYEGMLPGQLSFKKGQIIKQRCSKLETEDDLSYGYYRAGRLRTKRRGLFPSYCVTQLSDSRQLDS